MRLALVLSCLSACAAPEGPKNIDAKLARATRLDVGVSARVYFELPPSERLLSTLLAEFDVPSAVDVVYLPAPSEGGNEEDRSAIADPRGRVMIANALDFPLLDATRVEQLAFVQQLLSLLEALQSAASALDAPLHERLAAALRETMVDPARRRAWFEHAGASANCSASPPSPLGWLLETPASGRAHYALLALHDSSTPPTSGIAKPGETLRVRPERFRPKLETLGLSESDIEGVMNALHAAAAETAAAEEASSCPKFFDTYLNRNKAEEPHKRFLALAFVLDAAREFVEAFEFSKVSDTPHWYLAELEHYPPKFWRAGSRMFGFRWIVENLSDDERLPLRRRARNTPSHTNFGFGAAAPDRRPDILQFTIDRGAGLFPDFYAPPSFADQVRRLAESRGEPDAWWSLPPCIKWERQDDVTFSFATLPSESDLESLQFWLTAKESDPRSAAAKQVVAQYSSASPDAQAETYLGRTYRLYIETMRKLYWAAWIRSGGAPKPLDIHPREVLPLEVLAEAEGN